MKIHVTQEHIDQNKIDGLRNPIAMALNEQVGNFAFVIAEEIHAVEQKRPFDHYYSEIPKGIELWLRLYFSGKIMEPIDIEVEIDRS